MNLIQRMNTVQTKPKPSTERIVALRKEYKDLDIFDQAKKYEHYKSICESEGIEEFFLICQDPIFEYLMKDNLVERF